MNVWSIIIDEYLGTECLLIVIGEYTNDWDLMEYVQLHIIIEIEMYTDFGEGSLNQFWYS